MGSIAQCLTFRGPQAFTAFEAICFNPSSEVRTCLAEPPWRQKGLINLLCVGSGTHKSLKQGGEEGAAEFSSTCSTC